MSDDPRPEDIPVGKIRPGPVRGELSEQQQHLVRFIHDTSRHVTEQTLEETELDFMRDANPDDEIAIWLRIVTASREYAEQYPEAPIQSVAKVALHMSFGGQTNEPNVDGEELRAIFQSVDSEAVKMHVKRWAEKHLDVE